MIRIRVNGADCEIPRESTVLELIERLGLESDRIAVELNRELVTRRDHGSTRLDDGDRVEFVTLVGGG